MRLQVSETPNRYEPAVSIPRLLIIACVAAIIVGSTAIILGFILAPGLRNWLALVVWFVTFWGFAQGMIIWAAVFRIAQARWAPTVLRVGQSALFFIPVMYLVLLVLLMGGGAYMPWIKTPIPAKEFYLNVPFFVWRNVIGVALLFALQFLLVRWTLSADEKARRGDEITSRDQYNLTSIAIAATIVYTIVASIISYDFIMSLSPEWVSTMFAPYYWITNMYAGMAILIIVNGLLRRQLGQAGWLTKYQFQDMGNLMLGFSLFSMGLFFAQYLTIWYENLPWETPFLIIRYVRGPWPFIAWTAFILEFAIPFILLQSRVIKRNPRYSMPIAAIALVGFVIERYVLVIPSLLPGVVLLSILPLLGILAFAGAFILAVMIFLSRYSAASAAQALLPEVDLLEGLD